MKTEFEFDLKHPILYKPENSGEQIEGHKLILKEPSPKNMVERGLLKQEVSKIVEWITEKATAQNDGKLPTVDKEDKEDSEEDPEEDVEEMGELIVLGMYSAPGVNIKTILGEFRKLMVDCHRCSLEGEKDLTSALFDKIHPKDQDGMMGAYFGNFILQ